MARVDGVKHPPPPPHPGVKKKKSARFYIEEDEDDIFFCKARSEKSGWTPDKTHCPESDRVINIINIK